MVVERVTLFYVEEENSGRRFARSFLVRALVSLFRRFPLKFPQRQVADRTRSDGCTAGREDPLLVAFVAWSLQEFRVALTAFSRLRPVA